MIDLSNFIGALLCFFQFAFLEWFSSCLYGISHILMVFCCYWYFVSANTRIFSLDLIFARFSFIFIYNLLVKFLNLMDSQYLVNLYLYPAVLLIFIITLFFFLADDKWTFHRLHLITLSTFSISFSWYVEGSSANIMLMM